MKMRNFSKSNVFITLLNFLLLLLCIALITHTYNKSNDVKINEDDVTHEMSSINNNSIDRCRNSAVVAFIELNETVLGEVKDGIINVAEIENVDYEVIKTMSESTLLNSVEKRKSSVFESNDNGSKIIVEFIGTDSHSPFGLNCIQTQEMEKGYAVGKNEALIQNIGNGITRIPLNVSSQIYDLEVEVDSKEINKNNEFPIEIYVTLDVYEKNMLKICSISERYCEEDENTNINSVYFVFNNRKNFEQFVTEYTARLPKEYQISEYIINDQSLYQN